jgi:hypothetical protein
MSPAGEGPVPYQLVYSERVRNALRELLERARAQGIGRRVLDAVKAIDALLRLYPQFGQPLRDLEISGETLWIGTVAPVVARYVIDEERRLVFVVVPFKVLPGLGL